MLTETTKRSIIEFMDILESKFKESDLVKKGEARTLWLYSGKTAKDVESATFDITEGGLGKEAWLVVKFPLMRVETRITIRPSYGFDSDDLVPIDETLSKLGKPISEGVFAVTAHELTTMHCISYLRGTNEKTRYKYTSITNDDLTINILEVMDVGQANDR